MSLEACPVCGYALSTVTFQCRHCPAESQMKGLGMNMAVKVFGYAAAAAGIIYVFFFR